ncbi:MAG: tyrosine-protein phosphatase [Anaerolineae bacterium]|nr:tyrosine-protein phosphatase [Anaerolineae bacterium]
MKHFIRALLTFSVVGGVVAYHSLRGRKKRSFPPPESLIRDPSLREGREIPFERVPNFRDFGGYPTQDGRYVRRGLLYRSGALSDLSERDIAKLRELGIKLICDLRTDLEANESPDVPLDGVQLWRLPVIQQEESAVKARTFLFDRHRLDEVMIETYQTFVREKAHVFGAAITRFADPANLPALFHCSAGKDRTGILAALLLGALGVSDELIVADYTLSNFHYEAFRKSVEPQAHRLRALRLSLDDLQPMLVSDPAYMEAVLKAIRDECGSIEAYLVQKAGVSPETLARLREVFLSPSPT